MESSFAVGRARDIVTPGAGGAPRRCAEDSFEAWLKTDRSIVSIKAEPARPALSRLTGERAGGHLRKILKDVVPDELHNATPLYLILDDLSGTSLISSWAWSLWNPNWLHDALADADVEKAFQTMTGVCIGFAPGSSALDPTTERSSGTPVPDLRNPNDSEGWHVFTQQNHVGMRRARRIDVWLEDVIVIDSAFQDSATTPDGGRAAIHEYRLSVTADPLSLQILTIRAEPRILPFVECPSATVNLSRLIGSTLLELRENVVAQLRTTAGCTHLNDALRALADVPTLLRHLNDEDFGAAHLQ